MTENDIERLIERGAISRREEDCRHVEGLVSNLNADLGPWCARRRRIQSVIAAALLVAVPLGYSLLLPENDKPQVVCNQAGGGAAVMQCATQILTVI